MTSMNNWNIFVIWVDTFPDYRNVINNQGQRGSSDIDIGGGDSGDTCCWTPPPLIYVSSMDICIRSPLPRFLDNRVVLWPMWKLPPEPVLRSQPQFQTSVTVYGIRGGPRVTFTVCQIKSEMFHVCINTILGQNMRHPPTLPSDMTYGAECQY